MPSASRGFDTAAFYFKCFGPFFSWIQNFVLTVQNRCRQMFPEMSIWRHVFSTPKTFFYRTLRQNSQVPRPNRQLPAVCLAVERTVHHEKNQDLAQVKSTFVCAEQKIVQLSRYKSQIALKFFHAKLRHLTPKFVFIFSTATPDKRGCVAM